MTALTISHLPLAVGGAAASTAGRVGLWAIGRFARAPLAYTGIFAMTALSVMAASNVLYHQAHPHPSPFFSPAAPARTAALPDNGQPAPVRPQTQRQVVPTAAGISPQTTGSVAPAAGDFDGPVGNARVYAVQKKLQELNLFAGKVDGYYGPMTADAIRKFETGTGRQPEGALTEDVVDAILAAPTGEPLRALVMEPRPQPAAANVYSAPTASITPANVYSAPQAMPQPLAAPVTQQAQVPPLVFQQPQAQPQQPVLIARQVEPSATDIFDNVAEGAAGVFDAVATGVQDIVQQPQANVRQVQPPAATPLPPASLSAGSVATPRAQPAPTNALSSNDPEMVVKVQRGLASLGFLAGAVDGVPGEATAKAIRNFEVYYNYPVTGKITPQLVGMLENAGAVI